MIKAKHKAQRSRRRMPRYKGANVSKLIPNIITVSAACCGLTAIRFAIDENWDYAVIAIIAASILDALDGRMARILNASSEFGAQLDSLADIVSFGVAPALVLYFWSLQSAGGIGWAIALFIVVCCGLRLARFNSMVGKLPPYAYNYFTGIPAPAGALISLLPITIGLAFGGAWVSHPVVVGLWALIAAGMMVSRVPTYSFKQTRIPQSYILPLFVGVCLIVVGIASYPWITLSIIALLYLSSFPFSIRSFYRLKAEAERLHEREELIEEHDASVERVQKLTGTDHR